eukprot:586779-Amphidinium_carterae.1
MDVADVERMSVLGAVAIRSTRRPSTPEPTTQSPHGQGELTMHLRRAGFDVAAIDSSRHHKHSTTLPASMNLSSASSWHTLLQQVLPTGRL